MTNLEIIEDGGTYPRAAFIAEIERQGFVWDSDIGEYAIIKDKEQMVFNEAWRPSCTNNMNHYPEGLNAPSDLTVTLTD